MTHSYGDHESDPLLKFTGKRPPKGTSLAAQGLSYWKLQEHSQTEENEDWSTGPRTLLGQAFFWGFSTPQRARLNARLGEPPGDKPTSLTIAESRFQKSRHRWVSAESGLTLVPKGFKKHY